MNIYRIDFVDDKNLPNGDSIVTLRFYAQGMKAPTLQALKATRSIPEQRFKPGDRVTLSAKCQEDIGADLESERLEGDRGDIATERAHAALHSDGIKVATVEAFDGEWMYSLRCGKITFPGLHPAEDLRKAER